MPRPNYIKDIRSPHTSYAVNNPTTLSSLFVFVRHRSHQRGAAPITSTLQDVQFGHAVPETVTENAPDGRGREVEDDGVQAGVEGAGEQSYVPPVLAVLADEPHHVGHVVGPERHGEHQESSQCQADGPEAAAPADAGQAGQDADEVDVAETADEEGHAEEHQKDFEADRKQDTQLLRGEVQVTRFGREGAHLGGAVADRGVFFRNRGHDVHDAEVQEGDQPEQETGHHGVARPATQGVPEGERHPQVAFYTNCGQDENAVVDGGLEKKSRDWT